MNRRLTYALVLGLCFMVLFSYAQKSSDILKINGGKMVLRININLSQKQLDSVLKEINMMKLSLDTIRNKKLNQVYYLEGWEIIKSGKDFVEIAKDLKHNPQDFEFNNPFVINSDSFYHKEINTFYPEADFGFNEYKNKISVKLNPENGYTRFVYYGRLKANTVILSGSFNAWATEELKMVKTDTAWYYEVKLNPGKHLYKFIVDGEWINDPENKHKEDDTYGSYNSVYFSCNHEFVLRAHLNARKVIVAGSFNNWNERELVMNRKANYWSLPVYLKEGTYFYKFIVDREWITDPECKENRDDGMGNINSMFSIGTPTTFALEGFNYAREVYLCGDFNSWRTNEIKLRREGEQWTTNYVLAPGNYQYKFFVDGQWVIDPKNPYIVKVGDTRNSLIAIQSNYTFSLRLFLNESDVRISGSFFNWPDPGITMYRTDTAWVLPLHLKPGKHLYKYIIANQWMIDPSNPLFEQNEFDTGNSFIWIEQKKSPK